MGAPIDITSPNWTPEKIVEALMGVESLRPGLAYEVGLELCRRGASKEFPGPDPEGPTKSLDTGSVNVLGYDPSRRTEAEATYRELFEFQAPTYDPNDPRWLKATKAERRAAIRAVEEWPRRDPVPRVFETLDYWAGEVEFGGLPIPSYSNRGPKSRAEAEAMAGTLRAAGFTVSIEGFEEPAVTHRKVLFPPVGMPRA